MLNKILIHVFITLIIFSCDNPADNLDGDKPPVLSIATGDDISRINVPEEEHGYQFIENAVITSLDELNIFIEEINDQEYWNNKSDFLSAIQSEQTDFSIYNMIMLSHIEGSGSISVVAQDPVWEGDHILIHISRKVPEIGTCDMAYHLLVYRVNKKVNNIIFEVNDKRIEIENK